MKRAILPISPKFFLLNFILEKKNFQTGLVHISKTILSYTLSLLAGATGGGGARV